MTADFDYGDDARRGLGTSTTTDRDRIARLAVKQQRAEDEVAVLEQQLKAAKERLTDIAERQFPALLDELGLEKCTSSDGLEVHLINQLLVAEKPTQERRDVDMDWLEEHGAAAVVKRTFLIEFGKEDEAWARRFEADLNRRKRALPYRRERAVHPSTLKATLREMLESGTDVPLDLFGIREQRVTRLKQKKG